MLASGSDQDSPLQRVIAARRAAALQKLQQEHLPIENSSSSVTRVPLSWENNDSSGLGAEAPDLDQFMSWEPTSIVNWPTPFSL